MFDIGFSELLVIGVVALIVIGPERLPKVARTAGAWLGRLNRYVADVKQDIDREMQLQELRKIQQEMQATAQKYEILAEETAQEIKQELSAMDKLAQAISATDGGLAAQEYARLQAQSGSPETDRASTAAQAQGALPSETAAASAQATSGTQPSGGNEDIQATPRPAETGAEVELQLTLPGLEPGERKPS